MNVFGTRDHRRNDHAARFSRPLFDHQEAINKRWDRHSYEACRNDKQLIDAPVPTVGDGLRDEIDGFDKSALATGPKFAYTCLDFQIICHVHRMSPLKAD
jgi:hypothetical protein